MIDHSRCDHERSSKARAKCRRDNGATPRKSGATPRALNLPKDDEDVRPKDRDRQCHNCHLRLIEWKGKDRVNDMLRYVCTKCKYILDPAQSISFMEV